VTAASTEPTDVARDAVSTMRPGIAAQRSGEVARNAAHGRAMIAVVGK